MIELKDVTKRFTDVVALDALNLELGEGDVFGYIGPNGAGKSTTMKILACLIQPDSGSARVCGLDCRLHGPKIRKLIGYMPDFLGVYPDLKVSEYLDFFAAAYHMPRRDRKKIVGDVLELTDLAGKRDSLVDGLSRGMQQRLGVARVLIHDPKVLLLDEPASGLDPRARIEIRSLLMELRRMGKTIMVSSHILSELHEMCNTIGIIERGRLIFSGSIDDAIEQSGLHQGLEVHVDDAERAETVLRHLEPVEKVERINAHQLIVTLVEPTHENGTDREAARREARRSIPRVLIDAGIGLESLRPRDVKLEDVFLTLTKGEVS